MPDSKEISNDVISINSSEVSIDITSNVIPDVSSAPINSTSTSNTPIANNQYQDDSFAFLEQQLNKISNIIGEIQSNRNIDIIKNVQVPSSVLEVLDGMIKSTYIDLAFLNKLVEESFTLNKKDTAQIISRKAKVSDSLMELYRFRTTLSKEVTLFDVTTHDANILKSIITKIKIACDKVLKDESAKYMLLAELSNAFMNVDVDIEDFSEKE